MSAALGVICDMDGLLVDSEPLYRRAWQAGVAAVGFELLDRDYAATIGRTDADSEAHLLALFGDDFALAPFRRAWRAAWDDSLERGELEPKPGASALLEALHDLGAPLAVATSSSPDNAARSLRYTGLDGFFEHVVTGGEVAHGKPAPDIFLAAAARLCLEPARCIVLEDSPAGAEAGLAAGMGVVIVPDLQPPPAHCAERAVGVFASLHEAAPRVLGAVRDGGRRTPRP